ncbi:MAG: AIR synthase family protein [Dehalococcoidales bacterium]|jgi:hydrogenase maturation factor
MAEIPEIGKISAEIFNELIFPRLGSDDKHILVGPRHGTDVGIAEIGGQAVSFTCDPVFIVPEYGWERAAWFAIHILASDSVTSGLPPRYLSIDLNLPLEMTKEQLTVVWDTMHRECRKLGIAIITGHTARYENCHYPMVGGATVVGVGELDKYVSPRFIRPGDALIITKGPAIEASGIFATMFPKLMQKQFGQDFALRAEKLFYKMSVVEEARLAVDCGVRDQGVSAMHDATECGIWGGLYEVAEAAGCGIRVEQEKIVLEDCVKEICGLFGIDPYASISEGTLIIACRPHKAQQVVKAITDRGIQASVAGEFTEASRGMVLVKEKKATPLKHPNVDPFWKAFYDAGMKYKDYVG